MKTLALALLIASTGHAQTPTAYCHPDRSKPCGMGCIPKAKNCRKSWTTAVSGIRPTTAGKIYENPKFVSEPPKEGQ